MALLYVAVAFGIGLLVAGSAAGALVGCGWPGWLWLIPVGLLPVVPLLNRLERRPAPAVWPAQAGFIAPRRFPSPAVVGACNLALAAGFLRMASTPLTPCWTAADLAFYNAPAADAYAAGAPWSTVTGIVDSYVSQADGRSRISVHAHSVDTGDGTRAVQGRLTLLADPDASLQYGAPVQMRGVLTTPPDFRDFSYREYLARHGIHSQMSRPQVRVVAGAPAGNPLLRALYDIRARGERLINRALAEPYAALANGMLLGIESNIPDDVRERFNDTSASHVIVISGSNVALITGVLLALSAWFLGRRAAWVTALAGIAVYTLLVGAEPSVLRAALMGALVVVAAALGRQSTALVSLGAACLVMAAFTPHVLWDVGFQMSAAATAGLVLVAPRLSSGFATFYPSTRKSVGAGAQALHAGGRLLGDSLAVTLGASLTVLPLILYHFHRLSLVGVFTNLLIVPVQPLILFAGSAALLAGLTGLWPLAQLLFWGAWLGLTWTVAVVDATARVRWASVAIGGFGMGALLGAYAVLAGFVWHTRQRASAQATSASSRVGALLRSPLTLGALAAICAMVWLAVHSLPDGRLHIHILPVEKGAALLIEAPSGAQTLVDGGGDTADLLTELGGAMGFWDRSLDLVLLSAADKATAATQSGLPARLEVAQALGPPEAGAAVDAWARTWAAAGVPVSTAGAGGWVDLGDGASLWALGAPPKPEGKAQPLTWRLIYGDFSLLLVGGPAAFGDPADVLVLRDAADGDDWLTRAAPTLTVVYGAASLADTSPAVRYPTTDGPVHIWSDGVNWGYE